MLNNKKNCGIVILNYNTPEDTLNCIDSILRFNTASIKIVVVDNASSDQSVEILKERLGIISSDFLLFDATDNVKSLPFVSLVSSKENKGYACGNNCGIRFLMQDESVDTVLILNSDILFVEDIIPKMTCDLEQKNVAIVSPVLYKKEMTSYDYNCARLVPSFGLIFLHFLLSAHEPRFLKNRLYLLKNCTQTTGLLPVGLPSGSCMLFSKKNCKDIGIFDPNTFLYYEENIIAAQIAQKKLGGIFVDLDLKCIHLGASSTKKEPSRLIVEAEVHSALYYVRTFASSHVLKALFKFCCNNYLLVDAFKRFLKGRKK